MNQHRAQWSRASRGRIPGLREQAVAARIADYGNKDGSNNHPGIERITRDTCSSDKTVRRAVAWLIENGWLTISARGRRKLGEADTYQLTIPAPVAVHLGVWPEGDRQWMERPEHEPTRPELRRETPRFPAVKDDLNNSVLPVTSEFLPVTDAVLEVNVDLPPGPKHQGLSTPLREAFAAPPTSGGGARDQAGFAPSLDSDSCYAEALRAEIEETIGGPMHPKVDAMVTSMIEAGSHRKMIVRTAVAREQDWWAS